MFVMTIVSREYAMSALSICRQDFHAFHGSSQLAAPGP
jgi:hypothetical protein